MVDGALVAGEEREELHGDDGSVTREVLDGEQVRRIVAGLPVDEPKSPTAPVTHEEEPGGRRAKERPSLVPPLSDPLPQE